MERDYDKLMEWLSARKEALENEGLGYYAGYYNPEEGDRCYAKAEMINEIFSFLTTLNLEAYNKEDEN